MKTGILVSRPNTNANTQPKSRVALIDRDAREGQAQVSAHSELLFSC